MLRVLILVLSLRPLFPATVSLEVTTYAKVSKNGQLARGSHDPFTWITRALTRSNTSAENEARGINDIAITVSPVYVSPRIPKLKKGEAADYSVAPRYSTLDREMIAKLDAAMGRKQIQQRFHPPAVFEQTNGRPQKGASASDSGGPSSANSSTFPGPISFAGMYEYSPPPGYLDDRPASKPIISVDKYPSVHTDDKMPNSYKSPASDYHVGDERETDYPSFDVATAYENDGPAATKPMKFAGNHNRPFPFVEDTYGHDHHHHHHDFHHDVIYDHVPEYHEHYHEHTTQEPEMNNDQRLDKRPYSYYFIGKKLWYVPLYFSIYFIIYIAALVLKSIARHKIDLPAQLAEAAGQSKRSEPDDGWWNFAERILQGAERFAETSGRGS